MLRTRSVLVMSILGVLTVLAPALRAEIIWDFGSPSTLPPTIAEVNAAGGLRVDDKVFSDFTVVPTTLVPSGLTQTVTPDVTSIRLTGVFMSGELGIGFSGLWQAIGGELADTVITFKVTADTPHLIADNTLGMQGYLADNGASVTISEDVYARTPDEFSDLPIAHKEIYHTDFTTKEIDHQEFADEFGAALALAEIWVRKDVGASGGLQPEGIAAISYFYQTFSQIPEPATMAILFIGGAALIKRKRR